LKAFAENSLGVPLKSILILLGKFIGVFAIAFTIWHFTAPVGAWFYAGTADLVVRALDGKNITNKISSENGYIIVDHRRGREDKPLVLEYKGFTFNSVFLIALTMIVPGVNHKLRIKILIIGLLLLFPEQIFRLVVTIFSYYAEKMRMRDGGYIYPMYLIRSVNYVEGAMIRIDGQIIPVVVWAALFYYYKWHNIFTKRRKSKEKPQ